MPPIRIDAARLLEDLHALRAIGGQGRGVNRPTYSAADMEARNWLVARMADAGLEAGIDGIGSVLGRRAVSGPAVLTGSHLETHGLAGWLDGAYGVICGLEVARTLADHPDFADCAVDVIAFADEEAHFGSYLGARSFIGALDDAEIDAARGRADGTPLRVALARAGLSGLPRFQCQPRYYHAFFEAHIEQGDRLEAEGARIGVVSAIAASRLFRIVFTGQANHAGTTSMARRRDAGRAALHALASLDSALSDGLAGPDTVWTVTRIGLEPGAASVVPARAEVLLQVRDPDPERLARIETALREACEGAARAMRCPVEVACIARNDGAPMDPRLRGLLAEAAERHAPGAWMHMPSGAGHDAQHMSRHVPTAMLFVPSIGGISHHPDEDTAPEDLVLGAQILAEAIALSLAAARRV